MWSPPRSPRPRCGRRSRPPKTSPTRSSTQLDITQRRVKAGGASRADVLQQQAVLQGDARQPAGPAQPARAATKSARHLRRFAAGRLCRRPNSSRFADAARGTAGERAVEVRRAAARTCASIPRCCTRPRRRSASRRPICCRRSPHRQLRRRSDAVFGCLFTRLGGLEPGGLGDPAAVQGRAVDSISAAPRWRRRRKRRPTTAPRSSPLFKMFPTRCTRLQGDADALAAEARRCRTLGGRQLEAGPGAVQKRRRQLPAGADRRAKLSDRPPSRWSRRERSATPTPRRYSRRWAAVGGTAPTSPPTRPIRARSPHVSTQRIAARRSRR